MQLCIDIGNSRVKYGLFDQTQLLLHGADEREAPYIIKELFEEHPQVSSVIISSVSESVDADMVPIPETINHVILDAETPLPIKSLYSSPKTLGHDRIALAVAGSKKFPGCNTLVIDIGTCLTMDLIDASGTYRGGTISPGVELRFSAMHLGTSRLPLVEFTSGNFPDQIGKNTKECMQSGVIRGMAHEITGTIMELNKEFGELKVLLTGGQHHLFEVPLKNSIFADPNLVLRGLNHILLHNLP